MQTNQSKGCKEKMVLENSKKLNDYFGNTRLKTRTPNFDDATGPSPPYTPCNWTPPLTTPHKYHTHQSIWYNRNQTWNIILQKHFSQRSLVPLIALTISRPTMRLLCSLGWSSSNLEIIYMSEIFRNLNSAGFLPHEAIWLCSSKDCASARVIRGFVQLKDTRSGSSGSVQGESAVQI